MVLTCQLSSGMLDDYNYHYDKYDKIEEYDDKDRSQESTKKCSCVGEEAAGGRNGNKVIHYCCIYCW